MAHPGTPVPAGRQLPVAIETALRAHVRRRPDLALVVRYHPSDWSTYPRLPDEPRVHFSEPPREAIQPLILAARAVVVQTSTVGLESAVAGVPVVSVESSPAAYEWFSLAAQGVSIGAADVAGLPAALDAALSAPAASPGRRYQSDGRAAARVAMTVTNALARGALPRGAG